MDSSDQAKFTGDGDGDGDGEDEDFVGADSSLPNEDSESQRDDADLPELDRTAPAEPVWTSGAVPLEEESEESPKRRKVEPKEEVKEEIEELVTKDEKELEGERVAGVEAWEDGEKPALNGGASTPGADGGVDANGVANEVDLGSATQAVASTSNSKKSSKKKSRNNVWITKSTRKGKKKSKATGNNSIHNNGTNGHGGLLPQEDKVLITPIPRLPDRTDDSPEMSICLSRAYKAEKVELSEDRLTAGSTKGYRMVRATRGVVEGAWYFEIKVVSLGEMGHTRLGWTTEKPPGTGWL
ncbi:hypothetical protein MLD38_004192 [Melastoma candidum]|uniref:Uncharacterized protein n=1 Tax=Melastoma candidum TaxID=119954 RepID=A0ACB9S6W2_9MYRT|nr:hypothetical protein MLD38_004192 [Melastoma candidum]